MSDEYYIRCREVRVIGDLVLWWGPNRRGYTTSLTKAGIYTKAEADSIANIRGTDVPYAKAEIDALAHRVVYLDTLVGGVVD